MHHEAKINLGLTSKGVLFFTFSKLSGNQEYFILTAVARQRGEKRVADERKP